MPGINDHDLIIAISGCHKIHIKIMVLPGHIRNIDIIQKDIDQPLFIFHIIFDVVNMVAAADHGIIIKIGLADLRYIDPHLLIHIILLDTNICGLYFLRDLQTQLSLHLDVLLPLF